MGAPWFTKAFKGITNCHEILHNKTTTYVLLDRVSS